MSRFLIEGPDLAALLRDAFKMGALSVNPHRVPTDDVANGPICELMTMHPHRKRLVAVPDAPRVLLDIDGLPLSTSN